MIQLSFSRRATTAFCVFACLNVASQNGVAALQTSATPVQLGQLQVEHGKLLYVYHRLRHQDVTNQVAVLDSLIALAIVAISSLHATLSALTAPGDAFFALQGFQEIAANALTAVTAAALAE